MKMLLVLAVLLVGCNKTEPVKPIDISINPPRAVAVGKIGPAVGEYYIQRIQDGNVKCYMYNRSISCVRDKEYVKEF